MVKPETNHYDQAFEVLKDAAAIMDRRGIPPSAVPPALADFLIFMVLVLGKEANLSELAAVTIIDRQMDMVEAWRDGKPPFNKPKTNGKH